MHQALYRKYRPRTFGDVCGEDQVSSVLRYQTMHGKVSHAYLFCGPRGTGKTSCAKILAKAVNCLHPIDGDPCGVCEACQSIDAGSAPDVLEMDAASNNGVEYIRDIRDEVSFTPAALQRKVYIIDEVHMLSQSAFNALLKTLEEPPAHVIFILATTELHKLPATIISRCQRFDFRRIGVDAIVDRLLYIAENEGLSLDDEAARMLAKQAQGGMRDAISLFELCSGGGQAVTPERVRAVLGLTGIETVYKSAVAVSRGDIAGLFRIVDSVAGSAKDISVYWQELTSFWRDMLVEKHLGDDAAAYLDMTEPEMRVLHDAARRFPVATLTAHFALLDDAMQEMNRLPQNRRLIAEMTLVRMSDPRLCDTKDGYMARIAALEDKVAMLEAGITTPQTAPELPPVTPIPMDASEPTSVADERAVKKENVSLMQPITDISEVAERFMEKEPMAAAFLSESDCAISADGKRIAVQTVSPIGAQMLEHVKPSLLGVFRLCGFGEADTELVITSGAPRKEKKNLLDEIED